MILKKLLDKSFRILLSSKKYLIVIGGLILLLGFVKLFNISISRKHSNTTFKEYFNSNYKIFSLRIPKKLNFAGEKVPISKFDIHEAMEYELLKNTYEQSHSIVLHRRVNRWFPIIEPILRKNNIPDDFKFIALVESKLSNVVSHKGATGFWQIIKSTGTEYGMEINDEVDERYHVIKSTEIACKYFLDAYKRFNNWTLVAASYNLGMNGIARQLKKQQVDNFYDLKLNQETGKYVYKILAMKEIISRPILYGFKVRKQDKITSTIPTKRITVDSTIDNLTYFANIHGINYDILQLFNPWIRANTLNRQKGNDSTKLNLNSILYPKKYTLEIPISQTEIYAVDTADGCEVTLIEADSIKPLGHQKYNDSISLENCQIENAVIDLE